MSAEPQPHNELSEAVGRLMREASLDERRKLGKWVLARDRWYDLLREFEGVGVYLTARAKDREDTLNKRIESYARQAKVEITDWLPPARYIIGELDMTDHVTPMIFLRREEEPEHIRYFVYADQIKILPEPSAGNS